jgi:flagellar hook-associated protein 1 FlgK
VSSTFHGLNIASGGLLAQQTALEVVGQNIANANTPNYTRQQAALGSRSSLPSAYGNPTVLGDGAEVVTVRRIQDTFINGQLRASESDLAFGQRGKNTLDQVTSVFGEPSDTGLNSELDQFWNAWQALSLQPDSAAARGIVLQAGQAVASDLNRFSEQLTDIRDQQAASVSTSVEIINGLAKELAALNSRIEAARGLNSAPNELLDRRDGILRELSQQAEIQVSGDGGASDTVAIGGQILVHGGLASEITVEKDASGRLTFHQSESGLEVKVRGGEIGAALSLSEEKIPSYLAALNDIAKGLSDRVNELHRSGKGLDGGTGRDFFAGSGAGDLRVNPALLDLPSLLAASSSGAPGDGGLALALAGVRSEGRVDGATVNESYRSLVSKTATEAVGSDRLVQAQTKVLQQLTLQQQSVSGVNLDEEMTDMIRFQQAYNANARVLSAMNDMLGTLIDRLGQ